MDFITIIIAAVDVPNTKDWSIFKFGAIFPLRQDWHLAGVLHRLTTPPSPPQTWKTCCRRHLLLANQPSSSAGEVYARCLLCRVEILAEQVISEWQGGFRAGRGLVDQVAVLKQAVNAYMGIPLLKAACDLTLRSLVWQAMQEFGFTEWLIYKI